MVIDISAGRDFKSMSRAFSRICTFLSSLLIVALRFCIAAARLAFRSTFFAEVDVSVRFVDNCESLITTVYAVTNDKCSWRQQHATIGPAPANEKPIKQPIKQPVAQ